MRVLPIWEGKQWPDGAITLAVWLFCKGDKAAMKRLRVDEGLSMRGQVLAVAASYQGTTLRSRAETGVMEKGSSPCKC